MPNRLYGPQDNSFLEALELGASNPFIETQKADGTKMTDAGPHLYEDRPICAECGEEVGIVQYVSIAWPVGQRWQGMHHQLWLHPQCEAAAIERLEKFVSRETRA